jgi:hypothetical protein
MGADARQLLAAQQIAQNPSLALKSVKSPELPPVPLPTVVPQQPLPPPALVSKPITPPPPPAVVASFIPPPPPPPLAASGDSDLLRPKFKDPTPEFDGLPPMPSFKEPPPESDDLPTRPTFTDPAPEHFDVPLSPPPPSTSVTAPTPQKRTSSHYTSSKIASRSPSPADNGDLVLGSGKSTILRSGSAQSGTMTRGPRYPRNARAAGGSNVQNLVQNLNRASSPPTGSPLRLSGSPIKRPSSVVGRSAAALSRRTMASDAEDDVADKK